ncbi:MAG: hypothetical protein HYS05_02935 [Acidobacteria bacterium]|nr:hypothetical protein [Acidobacteriota bacterium]
MDGGPAALVRDVGAGAARQQQACLFELPPPDQLVEDRLGVVERLVDLPAVPQQQVEEVLAAIPRRRRDGGGRVEAVR